jgi:transcriptional regulator with XRE-family HTH domain
MENQGERLKKIRKELKLSQEEFGKQLGLTRAAIAAVEANNNKFSNEVLCKLAMNFDVNLNYLLVGKGNIFNAAEFEQAQVELAQEVRKILRAEGLIK